MEFFLLSSSPCGVIIVRCRHLSGRSVGALDVDAHKSRAQEYTIKEFPTIKLFVPGKSPADYHGAREAVPIVVFAYQQIKALVKDRLDEIPRFTPVELNSSNFDDLVIKSKKLWCVGFFSPSCKHDNRVSLEWKKAVGYLKGKVMSGNVNCDEDKSLMDRLRVQTCSTIMIFGEVPILFKGPQTARKIEIFAIDQWQTWRQLNTSEATTDVEVAELTGPNIMEEKCGSGVICFIAFVPDTLEPERRNKVFETMLHVAEKFKISPYKFVWTAHGKQPGLQNSIRKHAHVPLPFVAALNAKKRKYSIYDDEFGPEEVVKFVSSVKHGKVPFSLLKSIPKIVESEKLGDKGGLTGN